MTFSLILAWVMVLFSIVTAFKYIARISKCKRLNHIFHKYIFSSELHLF